MRSMAKARQGGDGQKRAKRVSPQPERDGPTDEADGEAEEHSEADGDGEALEGELVDEAALDGEIVDVGSDLSLPAAKEDAGDSNTSLARYDALQAYMRDVHRYDVLDAESQRQLAVQYRETGD